MSNVICCMVFGERFNYDDKQFLELLHIIAEVLRFNSSFLGQVSGGSGQIKNGYGSSNNKGNASIKE